MIKELILSARVGNVVVDYALLYTVYDESYLRKYIILIRSCYIVDGVLSPCIFIV